MKKNSLFFVLGLTALSLMALIFLFFRWFDKIDFLEGIDSYTYQNADEILQQDCVIEFATLGDGTKEAHENCTGEAIDY